MRLPAATDPTKTHLGRAFRVLCLEWAAAAPDGADAAPVELRARVERLTSLGVDVALIAQGGIDAVDPRLYARPDVEGRLFLLLSDGAEAYVLGPAGPRLIDRRLMTPDEDAQLSEAVETVRDALGAKGLPGRIGSGRHRHSLVLGRPPGDDLLERLIEAGIGGWSDLVELAGGLAHTAGVPRPCVSWRDGRLDFALTDFADSMRWLLQWIVRYRDYDAREVLVVGADFGLDGGAGGAARRLMIPELHGAAFASVGAEHDAGARNVQRVGGGHAAVLDLLDEQIVLREARVLESFPSPSPDRADCSKSGASTPSVSARSRPG